MKTGKGSGVLARGWRSDKGKLVECMGPPESLGSVVTRKTVLVIF